MILKQSTNYTRQFLMISSSDHISPATGKTPTVELGKAGNAGVAASGSGSIAEVDAANLPGIYKITLNATDTNTIGDLVVYCTAANCDQTSFVDQVQTQIFTDLSLNAFGQVAIASSIKQNQICNGFQFIMTNSTTHAPQTGLTVTAQRSLAGAGFAPCANPVAEMSNGVYVINLAAADTNANCIMYRFTAVGADDLDILIMTQP